MSIHGMSSRHASQVKRGGHLREQIFSNQFTIGTMANISQNVNYTGSSADCILNNPDFIYILSQLNVSSGNTSVKGGSNFQFHLGRIPDLLDYDSIVVERKPSAKTGKLETCFSSNITSEQQFTALTSYDFWKKYLGKGEMLAIDYQNHWHFFSMREVLNLLINPHCIKWRFLPTGRIKGDLIFTDQSKKAGITFEHRFEKNQSVIGAHGGSAGVKSFFPWLIDHLHNVVKVRKMTT
jgi:hypothetical protein